MSYHQFLDEDQQPYGSFEVFPGSDGWYWWSCWPGCVPDAEAEGPFMTAEEAYHNALYG